MMRILYGTQQGWQRIDVPPDELEPLLAAEEGTVWVDLADKTAQTAVIAEPILRDIFHFHPLAIDDALREIHSPKLDDWERYLYVVIHGVDYDVERERPLQMLELDCFIGHHFLVTIHEQPLTAVDRVWALCEQDHRLLKKGPDHLFYRLADETINGYMDVVDRLQEELNDIEDQIFDGSDDNTLSRIFTLKRTLLKLRRHILPQRELFNKMARDNFAVIDAPDRIFFRDLYDHMLRLNDLTDSLRDLVTSAMDSYLSVINNRMNNVMKTLTLIATLFMPLTFLTGFFGMNFFQATVSLDAWTGRLAFAGVLLILAMLPAAMYWWMRRRAWT